MNTIYRLLGVTVVAGTIFACSPESIKQANYFVVPQPQSIRTIPGNAFQLTDDVKILYPAGNGKMEQNVEFLADYIEDQTGKDLKTETGASGKKAIVLSLGLESENPEAYRLTVSPESITIQGASEAGVFYGIQTLRKSIPVAKNTNIEFPAVEISDAPRFSYRGAHLDVSRHFFTVDSVKRFIDMLALHNLNRFHWHLTDDQGWRIEIKKHPKLTEIGAKRKETVIGRNSGKYDGTPYGEGLFYTQEEAKEIVEYAQKRHITIIPEIDLPGHMQAALTVYPELGCTGGPYEVWTQWGVSEDVLCAGNDKTLEFIDDVLSEIVEIFPSEYIHIGGDECPKVRWEKCPKCQARIKALGLKADSKHSTEERLQSFVISHATQFLASKDRKTIGWDEILEGGLAPGATVMSWRGMEGGAEAARQGHDAIMTPTTFLYFDYYQTKDVENEPLAIGGYVPIEMVYNFEPVPVSLLPEQQKHIIGVQANLWVEYIPNYRHVEYMELPRMAALSEIQWTMPEKKNYDNFLARIPRLVAIYDLQGYNYAKHIFGVDASFTPNTAEGVLDIVLSAIDTADIHYTLDGTEPTVASEKYTDTLKIKENSLLRAVVIRPNRTSRIFSEEVTFSKASMKPITMLQPINKQYEYKGAITLIDGLKGSGNYKTGRWIAFLQNNMEAVVDLIQPTEISRAQIETCVEKGDWVFDARYFGVEVSDDGKTFRNVASESYPAMLETDRNGIYEHVLVFSPVTTRYVKVTVKPEYKMPAWHGSKDNPAFLFIDEITLN